MGETPEVESSTSELKNTISVDSFRVPESILTVAEGGVPEVEIDQLTTEPDNAQDDPSLKVLEEDFPLETKNKSVKPPDSAFGFHGGDKKEMLQMMKYYVDHPEKEPPLQIKNFMMMLRLQKEDKARRERLREQGLDTDESSDIFTSSEEDSPQSFDSEKDYTQTKKGDVHTILTSDSTPSRILEVISKTGSGIRVYDHYLSRSGMQLVQFITFDIDRFTLHLSNGKTVEVSLPPGVQSFEVVKEIETWLEDIRIGKF